MPEFRNPFAGLAHERKLNREELIRAVRFSVAAEYEAIQLYMQLAESTDDELAAKVLRDVADEERVHAGEFLHLLKSLDPEEEKFYADGAVEVEEMMGSEGSERTTGPLKRDLEFCTTAPDPEHQRAYQEDEACDDSRAGDYEKRKPGKS
jgi:rubrerythrin